MFVCDKRDRAITCMLCCDLHLALMFSCFYKKICLKESDVWRKARDYKGDRQDIPHIHPFP